VFTEAGDTETAVRIRAPRRDRFGDPLPDASVETSVYGCLFAPTRSGERTGTAEDAESAANTVETDAVLYAPPWLDVLPSDQFRIRDVVYEVIGRPQHWGNAGTVVILRRVTG
jgi:hypothetical protein